MSTIFTKIINKEIPADIVYEDDELLAFNDIAPQAPVHILIIPKKEISTLNNLKTEDGIIVGKMILLAKDLAKKYKEYGMAAYSRLQQKEFDSEKEGYTATKHQREVGTSYFDAVSNTISSGESSTTAMKDSTETDQF